MVITDGYVLYFILLFIIISMIIIVIKYVMMIKILVLSDIFAARCAEAVSL